MNKYPLCLSLLFTLLLASNLSYSQNIANIKITISGVVADSSDKKPLAGAVVSLYMTSDTLHYVTDTDGLFSFSVDRQPLYLEALYLGYRISRIKTNKNSQVQQYDTIKMVHRLYELDAAVVRARVRKIVFRGDTVQFNAAGFKTLPGANVADLLEKLPGIKIENGVWFQGERVSGAYVDGKKVFGTGEQGLYNLIGNLDAKDVISIEAFKEQSDEDKHLNNISAPKKWILNVITFSKLTEMTIGHSLLSYGNGTAGNLNKNNKYGAGVTLNYFGDKKGNFQSNIFYNNINRRSNRIEDISVSAPNSPGESRLTVIDVSGSFFPAKNNLIEVQPKYSFERTNSSNISYGEQIFFPTTYFNSRSVADSSSLREVINNHNFGARIVIKPKKHIFEINLDNTFSKRDNNSFISNSNIIDNNTVSQFRNRSLSNETGFNGNYNAQWIWRKSSKFQVGTFFSVSVSDNSRQEIRKDTSIQNSTYIYLNSSGPIQANSSNITIRPSILYDINRYNVLNASLTYMLNNNQSQKIVVDNITGLYDYSQMYDYTDRSNTISPDITLTRDRGQKRLVLGFSAPVTTQNYVNNETGSDRNKRFFSFLPSINYEINGLLNTYTSKFFIFYRSSVSVPGSNMLTPAINSGKGSYLTAGNPDLKQSQTYYITSGLNFMENEFSFNSSISASYTANPISLSGFYYFSKDTILQRYNDFAAKAGSYMSVYMNGEGKYTITPKVEISLPVDFVGSILSTSLQYRYSYTPQYIGNDTIRTNQQSAALGINLKSNFSKIFEFGINSQSSFTYNNRSSGMKDRFFTEQLALKLNTVIFSGRLNISAYSNTLISLNPDYKSSNQTISVLNASVSYKFLKERNAGIGISAFDLLNSNHVFQTSTSPQSQTRSWSQVPGRYFMFNLSYKFNYKKSAGKRINEGGYNSKSAIGSEQ